MNLKGYKETRGMYKTVFGKNDLQQNKTNTQYYKMLSGEAPVFSYFGENIYASDIVKICVDRVATHCSKLQPKHIRINDKGRYKTVNSEIERLLRCKPNPLMTTSEYIYKTTALLLLNNNAFIYPLKQEGKLQGLYPLNPYQVDFLENGLGDIHIKFYFANGSNVEMPYSQVIHLRKYFSTNDLMGDNDNADLLKTLQLNQTSLEGIEKAIKTSFQIRGLLKYNTILDDIDMEKQITAFENKLRNNKSGIMPMDLKAEYTDLKIDPKIVEESTLNFLQSKVLNRYGVSLPIFNNLYTEEEYNSFYESTIEPISIMSSQAYTGTLFSMKEQDFGNKIEFYSSRLQYASWSTKVSAIKELMPLTVFTLDDALNLLGMPPAEENGDMRLMSLNNINVKIADEYQLNQSKIKKEEQIKNGEEAIEKI